MLLLLSLLENHVVFYHALASRWHCLSAAQCRGRSQTIRGGKKQSERMGMFLLALALIVARRSVLLRLLLLVTISRGRRTSGACDKIRTGEIHPAHSCRSQAQPAQLPICCPSNWTIDHDGPLNKSPMASWTEFGTRAPAPSISIRRNSPWRRVCATLFSPHGHHWPLAQAHRTSQRPGLFPSDTGSSFGQMGVAQSSMGALREREKD